jgi:hypothetical protein
MLRKAQRRTTMSAYTHVGPSHLAEVQLSAGDRPFDHRMSPITPLLDCPGRFRSQHFVGES